MFMSEKQIKAQETKDLRDRQAKREKAKVSVLSFKLVVCAYTSAKTQVRNVLYNHRCSR